VFLLPLLAACGTDPATDTAAAQLTPATWCDGIEGERLGITNRLSGKNRARLAAAQTVLAPGLGATRAVSGLSLLGGYQEEMQKARPDVASAAMYLATASGVPVTPELVGRTNALLCVTTTAQRARVIASTAEEARLALVAEQRP
jgi:hypothetical protein